MPLLAGRASRWKFISAEDNPALRPGAQIVTFERGRGDGTCGASTSVDGNDVSVTTVDDVMQYVRPIETPEAAIAYSALVRELGVTDAGAHGRLVRRTPPFRATDPAGVTRPPTRPSGVSPSSRRRIRTRADSK